MEDFDKKRLQKSGEKFMSQYMALEEEALHLDPEDSLTWRGKPKLHYLGHILDEARKGIHPKGGLPLSEALVSSRWCPNTWTSDREGPPQMGTRRALFQLEMS